MHLLRLDYVYAAALILIAVIIKNIKKFFV